MAARAPASRHAAEADEKAAGNKKRRVIRHSVRNAGTGEKSVERRSRYQTRNKHHPDDYLIVGIGWQESRHKTAYACDAPGERHQQDSGNANQNTADN